MLLPLLVICGYMNEMSQVDPPGGQLLNKENDKYDACTRMQEKSNDTLSVAVRRVRVALSMSVLAL